MKTVILDAVVLFLAVILVVVGLVVGPGTVPGAVLVAVGAGFAVTRVVKVVGRSRGRGRP